MSRRIICLNCYDNAKGSFITSNESRHGWTQRAVFLSLPKTPPADHGVTVNGVFAPMPDFHCDNCNEVISAEITVAVTVAPPEREIGDWESDVGKIMTDEEVLLYRRIAAS